MIYLDHASTTPIDPEVLQAMMPYLTDLYGNPSSLHKAGQAARAVVDKSRMSIASYLACQPTELFFTSSGTESCNWAIFACIEKRLLKGRQAHIVVSAIEHSSVLETARFLERTYGVQVTEVPVSSEGFVDPDDLLSALRPETVIVSVMLINNEIGTLQPVAEIGKICHQRDVLFHIDACQASPYFSLKPDDLNADLLSLNASKINGPKGIGALYIKEGTEISPWIFGGGQEFGMRAGTENVAGIVGLGKSLELVESHRIDRVEQVTQLRDKLWDDLQSKIPQLELNGSLEKRSPNNLNFYIPGVDAETMVKKLDIAGFAVSAGSACASGKSEPSHVLLALGHNEERAKESLRVSLSHLNTEGEMEEFVSELAKMIIDH
jgi:cysteine desulfurase